MEQFVIKNVTPITEEIDPGRTVQVGITNVAPLNALETSGFLEAITSVAVTSSLSQGVSVSVSQSVRHVFSNSLPASPVWSCRVLYDPV